MQCNQSALQYLNWIKKNSVRWSLQYMRLSLVKKHRQETKWQTRQEDWSLDQTLTYEHKQRIIHLNAKETRQRWLSAAGLIPKYVT